MLTPVMSEKVHATRPTTDTGRSEDAELGMLATYSETLVGKHGGGVHLKQCFHYFLLQTL